MMSSLTHQFSDQKFLFRRVHERPFFVLILSNQISKIYDVVLWLKIFFLHQNQKFETQVDIV